MPTRKATIDHAMLLRIARQEVEAAVSDLPADIRARVKSVPVFLERRPDAADVAEGIEADTLGIFDEGAPQSPTPRIRIWVENLWDLAEGEVAAFRAEVRTTLLHEIGHVLGWDEADLDARGLG
ncbi:MAG TPA: metallopeptidase family protein [Terrimicrobiaceae bacterium]